MDELELAQGLAIGLMVAIFAVTAWRKRNFVLIATLGLFAITAVEFVFHPRGATPGRDICTLPGITWQAILWDDPTQWYRLFTSLFLHDACNAAHIVGNVFTFVLLGWPLEEKIGWKLTAAVFLITGLVGAVISTGLILAYGDPGWIHAYTLGASGAIFGIIGYFATKYPHEKVWAPILVVFLRVPVVIAAVAALAIQTLILLQVNNPFVGQLPWPSVMAHVMSFGVGMLITRIPWLQPKERPSERTFDMDLAPLRDLAVRPADKTEVEGIIAEDIAEVAQVKLEAFVRRAHCPRCSGPLTLKGRKLESDCGWSVTFGRRPPAPRK